MEDRNLLVQSKEEELRRPFCLSDKPLLVFDSFLVGLRRLLRFLLDLFVLSSSALFRALLSSSGFFQASSSSDFVLRLEFLRLPILSLPLHLFKFLPCSQFPILFRESHQEDLPNSDLLLYIRLQAKINHELHPAAVGIAFFTLGDRHGRL
ncbi:hypothetical protein L249_1982 [Ophiocordyceps polyrhachis-furcata BCC 54312]|uniref:Uncharacterized protein n=1 Tax=Ophiocordyceps polyrhachis-furcata BCC 54312 TaxID=1330021 RepID=A0A367LQ64_9HYPO|nr:hypothetical protein L249_1982 [Ophiocordyceps polyrhachis-furcata BCC 54312]